MIQRTRRADSILWLACVATLLASCSSHDHVAGDGVVVFEGPLQLVRNATRDLGQSEYTAPATGTYVAIVEEDDVDVRLRLERAHPGAAVDTFVDVESRFDGEGIEVAALDVQRGDRLALKLEGPHEFDRPGRINVKLFRYDSTAQSDARVRGRVAALRAWTAATRFDITADEMRAGGYRELDAALAHLQSPDGDPHLAAWARLVRANRSYRYFLGSQASLADARLACDAFAKLGEARNLARARFAVATALFEIANDKNAENPTAEEAGIEGERIFRALIDDPALSARERARSVNNLGYRAYNAKAMSEAQTQYARSLALFRAIGDRDGVRMTLANLGVIAGERGELQTSLRMFDELYTQLGEILLPERRAVYLYNGAQVHLMLGNTDRAIERFLLMLQWSREAKIPQNEARALWGLGLAYWQRGDLAQAATFVNESLKVRRQIKDPIGLMVTLQSAGGISREAGDTRKALALHQEALGLAVSDDMRMRTRTQIALDFAAEGANDRAIANLRTALEIPAANSTPYRRRETELALAEALLAREGGSARDTNEAATLAANAQQAAAASTDITTEQAARKILADSLVARGEMTAARREYERAVALVFKYRATTTSPEQRATVLTRTQATFRGYIDLLMRDTSARNAGKLLAVGNAEEEALRVLESARAINFDSVRVARLDLASQSRIDELLAQMAQKRVRMAATQERVSAPGPELESLQLDIASLRAQIDLERTRGSHDATGAGPSPEIAQSWPKISPGTTQLSYALGERYAYLWVRDSSGIRATVLPRSPAAIERDLVKLTELIRMQSSVESAELARVSRWLIPDDAIASDSTRLEIVAEGRIAGVPFAALVAPGDRSRRIVELHSIAMISSMFEGADRNAGAKHLLRFVALWGDSHARRGTDESRVFPPLAAPAIEARSIAAMFAREAPASDIKLLTGEEGNSEALKALWSGGGDVFHFATHGLADLRQPLASLLMLPAVDATGSPTYLTAGQVQEWRGDAGLVYLSACETALGPVRFADGMPGLQRAFLRAGAHGVIATLWTIEDAYASQFATDFYRKYTAGIPAVQALSETQRDWMRPVPGLSSGEQAHRRMTAWAHVYYAE